MQIDPRYYQLTIQSSLLIWGIFFLGFAASSSALFASQVIATFGTALLLQYVFTRWVNRRFAALSTINTSMSIILLLHASHWVWFVLAAAVAISSKFLIRYRHTHIFNPSNIGIVVTILLVESAWAAPGQWGREIWLALLLGGAVLVMRLGWRQMLTSLVFLVTYGGLLLMRAWYVGDLASSGLAIPIHQLQNGALLIFTFFMLSDPMTTPAHTLGRVIYGSWVALLAVIMQFTFYTPNAFLYALAVSSPLVIVLNSVLRSHRYQWQTNH